MALTNGVISNDALGLLLCGAHGCGIGSGERAEQATEYGRYGGRVVDGVEGKLKGSAGTGKGYIVDRPCRCNMQCVCYAVKKRALMMMMETEVVGGCGGGKVGRGRCRVGDLRRVSAYRRRFGGGIQRQDLI